MGQKVTLLIPYFCVCVCVCVYFWRRMGRLTRTKVHMQIMTRVRFCACVIFSLSKAKNNNATHRQHRCVGANVLWKHIARTLQPGLRLRCEVTSVNEIVKHETECEMEWNRNGEKKGIRTKRNRRDICINCAWSSAHFGPCACGDTSARPVTLPRISARETERCRLLDHPPARPMCNVVHVWKWLSFASFAHFETFYSSRIIKP